MCCTSSASTDCCYWRFQKGGREFTMVRKTPLSQPYDTSLKATVEKRITKIVPRIVPGMRIERELNIELVRPVLRGDKVYLTWYREAWHILHIEFESGDNIHMPVRMLSYHGNLHLDHHDENHHYPVISIIIYPFWVKHLPVSPYIEKSGDEVLLAFHFYVIPLYEMEASQFVRERAIEMYTLLPTMKGATKELLLQAIAELVDYYQDDIELFQQLRWMRILLERSTTVKRKVKKLVQEEIDFFDRLWNEDPKVRKTIANARNEFQAKYKAKYEKLYRVKYEKLYRTKYEQELVAAEQELAARVEERVEEVAVQRARWDALRIIQKRFPDILQLAQEKLEQTSDLKHLDELFDQLIVAPDEASASSILNKPVL